MNKLGWLLIVSATWAVSMTTQAAASGPTASGATSSPENAPIAVVTGCEGPDGFRLIVLDSGATMLIPCSVDAPQSGTNNSIVDDLNGLIR